MRGDASDAALAKTFELLVATRPTAINLKWALDEMKRAACAAAACSPWRGGLRPRLCDCRGGHRDQPGNRPARSGADRGGRRNQEAGEPVNILTHCNAGWLAAVDWGTATAPIYLAHDSGVAGPCLGRRDQAAQSGGFANGLGTWTSGRPAHGYRGQYRRSSDATWRG